MSFFAQQFLHFNASKWEELNSVIFFSKSYLFANVAWLMFTTSAEH